MKQSPQASGSSSPLAFKLYLPSEKMEPHRSISREDLVQLKASLEEDMLRVQLRNRHGLSPIEHAIDRQYHQGVSLLLKHGANPAITCEETVSNGFHHAAQHGTPEIVKLIMVHTPFGHIQDELKRLVANMGTAESQDSRLRRIFAHTYAQTLTEQHLKQLELLVTQLNVYNKSPEEIACQNEVLKPLFAKNGLRDLYGDLIRARYITEFMMSFSQIN